MPDQTPVTIDDRNAHAWADRILDPSTVTTPDELPAARAIRAHVPAPPATLADELRYRATLLYNGDPDGDSAAVISALADRVEAVEKERDEHVRDYRVVRNQRDEARAEVERLTSGRTVRESRTVDLPDPA
ncbi:hypothetical protein [Corynebacterium sp. AOP40-4SA-5]|uniref:hypothetical protein n=1 Tax=Corynebacterium sp. AOP40-4SA-5 TaxID=3457678 RepID=UPI0040349209